MAIPKIIHYCWFGGNELPKMAKKCIKSWKKYCKGYEIRQWNEQNFDIASAPLYVRQACEAKKWAFVTDYVRLYAMTTYGGIYIDTDVEIVRPLDEFLQHQAFSGFEDEVYIQTGIMACEKGFPMLLEFLRYYDTAYFYNADGSMNMTTNVTVMTDICIKHGLIQNGQYQCVDGLVLYPKDVFCPLDYSRGKLYRTKQTAAIHWFNGSWVPEDLKRIWARQARQRRFAERKDFWQHLPNRIAIKVLGKERYESVKALLKR